AVTQVSVESPLRAICLPLETVYERFQQPAHGFRDLLGQYLSGEKPKGILETEEMLRVGAGLTGIGELALHPDGSLHLQPPARGGDEEIGDGGPEDSCVICLSRPRECVLLGCGHICCCFRCFQALPARLCPICRGPIDRVVPLYQA
ncbi:hypothetical protein A306_00000487, partial [Columba livia]